MSSFERRFWLALWWLLDVIYRNVFWSECWELFRRSLQTRIGAIVSAISVGWLGLTILVITIRLITG